MNQVGQNEVGHERKKESMKTKRKLLILIATIFLVAGGILLYLLVPQKMLHTNDQVTKITLFDGNSGKSAIVTDPEEIAYIKQMFNDKKFSASGIGAFRMGYGMEIKFFNEEDKKTSEFIVSNETKIRYSGLFYEMKDDSIDYEYLKEKVK